MRLPIPLLLLVFACGTATDTPDAGPDAGTEIETDAGEEPVDAGEEPVDAGEQEPDAGEDPVDAGEEEPDAGGGDACDSPCNAPDGPGDCLCFANAHCGEAFRCSHDLECVCGKRGTKPYEARCSKNEECESGVCAEQSAGSGYCSKVCNEDACDGTRLTLCVPFDESLSLCWYD